MVRSFEVKVPCSSANIGPGYDVLGIGLSMYLTIKCSIDAANVSSVSHNNNCIIEYTKDSEGYDDVPLQADKNLITKTALYVLRCNGIRSFPSGTKLLIHNPIPLGRGLGSSGAAVVAGVMLGSEVGKLNYSRQRMLDYCLMIERHPDNISAAMMGGFVGSFLRDLSPQEVERREIPLSEVFSDLSSGGEDTGLSPPLPPQDIGRHLKFQWNDKIKCIAIIPNFEVSTADSRGVLPKAYTTSDVVFNLQRLSILTTALTLDPPNPDLIYPAMQDRLHQPYRKTLIPGLPQILQSVTPSTHNGLLGICLSGAGPTILALATENFEDIAAEIISEFKKKHIECDWKLLTLADDGATIVRDE